MVFALQKRPSFLQKAADLFHLYIQTFMSLALPFYIFCLFFPLGISSLRYLLLSLLSMNNCRDEYSPYCYFHPKEVIVGICALCLRERLLNLASKQGHLTLPKANRTFRVLRRRPTITLPKVFALGSLLHRLKSRRQRPDDNSDEGSIASLEDSFISIKFENNGQASWENKKQEIADHSSKESNKVKSVVEHLKPRGTMRWHKKIDQLLQLAHWKRSSKAGAAHVGLVGEVEGRRGWISSLTRRRATD